MSSYQSNESCTQQLQYMEQCLIYGITFLIDCKFNKYLYYGYLKYFSVLIVEDIKSLNIVKNHKILFYI